VPTRMLLVAAAMTAIAVSLAPPALARQATTYEVTVENLTSGQPLTPPVAATHRGKSEIFHVGAAASFGVKEIAENGNNAPLLDALAANKHVSDSAEAPGGPLVPAGTPGSSTFDDVTTFTLDADGGAKRLSLVSMLICTNDGFTGVNSLKLPKKAGHTTVALTAGYDAGTEVNTEDFADIVPPCQSLISGSVSEPGAGTSNPALREGGVIRHHPNIAGGADLDPAIHGWMDPVARVTVEAIR
jgi:hypothetical protein